MNDKQKKAAIDGVLEFYDSLRSLVYAIQQTPSLEEVERDSMILFASEIKNTFSNTLRDIGVDVPKILTDNLGESMNQRIITGKAKEALLNDEEDNDDKVNHPSHYMSYYKDGIECIDAMKAAFGEVTTAHFCIGNAFKYIWRHASKNGMEDINKALWYLNKYKEINHINMGG